MPIPPKRKIRIIIAIIILGRIQSIRFNDGSVPGDENVEVVELNENQLSAPDCAMINAAIDAAAGEGLIGVLTINTDTPTGLTALHAANVVEVEFVFASTEKGSDVERDEDTYNSGELAAIDALAGLAA